MRTTLLTCLTSWLALLLSGCTLVQLRHESGVIDDSVVLVGRVECPHDAGYPVLVAAITDTPDQPRVAHEVLLHECGGFELVVAPGRHRVVAVADQNRNGRADPGEASTEQVLTVSGGTGVLPGIDLRLPAKATRSADSSSSQALESLPAITRSTLAGAIADWDDPAFAPEQAAEGYWKPMSFFRHYGGNVYALEPYDPERVPVLFVHGAAGSPLDLKPLVDRLDRTRYQAWVYNYPSGAAVESTGYLLYWKLLNLQLRYRFTQWAVVAHSMGGLVARTALTTGGPELPPPKLFVSISTPWGGEPAAELGVRHSPAVVPSWHDMRPDGPFMAALFRRPLHANTEHALLFGHRGGYSLMRPSTDGTVTLASQLRPEAQATARRVLGFDEDHMSILASAQVQHQLRGLLDDAVRPDAAPQARIGLEVDLPGDVTVGTPMLTIKPLDGPGPTLTMTLAHADLRRPTGPLSPGRYEVSLIGASFKALPMRRTLELRAGETAQLRFTLHPTASLAGFIGAPPAAPRVGAGVRLLPGEAPHPSRVVLTGAGVHRELRMTEAVGHDELLQRLINGQDVATRSYFAFANLPAGDYELLVEGGGHAPHRSRYMVVPGRATPVAPILLQPLQ
jgi:hypothetical protein